MNLTAMQWLRAGAKPPGAQLRRVEVAAVPKAFSKSPCCKLLLLKMPRGTNDADHYRCAECGTMFVWSGSAWVLCELPEKHRAQSREIVMRLRDEH